VSPIERISRRHRREADAALRMALAVAESIKFPTQIWKTHVARAKLTRASGDADSAFKSVVAAQAILDDLKRGVRDPELAAALARERPGARPRYVIVPHSKETANLLTRELTLMMRHARRLWASSIAVSSSTGADSSAGAARATGRMATGPPSGASPLGLLVGAVIVDHWSF